MQAAVEAVLIKVATGGDHLRLQGVIALSAYLAEIR
jgi:hypothetical protein